jgi:hypothetical protein
MERREEGWRGVTMIKQRLCIHLKCVLIVAVLLWVMAPMCGSAQEVSAGAMARPVIVQPVLIENGSSPFHLKAIITDKDDPESRTAVELFWASPEKYRRIIQSRDFSQTLIVNGSSVFEDDSEDYFPLDLQIVMTALVDPRPVLNAYQPGDLLFTKANGRSKDSGDVCRSENACGHTLLFWHAPLGLNEIVGSLGPEMQFTDYRDFKGRRVARLVFHRTGFGASGLEAVVTELSELKSVPKDFFEVRQSTSDNHRNHTVFFRPEQLRNFAEYAPEIIWPQTLDGAEKGIAVFHIAIDPTGEVRDVVPLRSDNERADESAARQIKAWKFKPVMDHDIPVEVETFLTVPINTRGYGPTTPLNDAEARALATNIVEPAIPGGTVPSGSIFTLRAAIDVEGRLIEVIGGQGEHKMYPFCYNALKQWQFSPVMENGKPRPYRAEISFRMP